ncbi:fimbria/pilus periplasmic chaperone [Citrobacter amalonaticus]|uniref:fimbria/pilus periplasmic chaperone n=1 Tax=Citrobacter amalonaticus TaxID=35703 RepID=UPI00339C2F9B
MKGLVVVILFSMIFPVNAGVVIYGTRVVYPAEKKEVIVQLMNQGTHPSLVQTWIDDGDTTVPPEKLQLPFMITPPVSRIAGESGQQLKIKKMPGLLPENKESLFFLNVLDIPPNNPENNGKNILKFAMQNRIKLFWRPKGIAAVNKMSFQKLALLRRGSSILIKNDTANWITVTDIKTRNSKLNDQTIMLAPLSEKTISLKKSDANQYVLTIIDDHGNYISDNVGLH